MQSLESLNSNDKMRGLCFKIARSLLIIVNLIIAVLAALFIYVSFNLFSPDYELDTGPNQAAPDQSSSAPTPKLVHTYVIITCASLGFIVALLALLGLIGSVKKSKSFLGTYAAIIFLMVSLLFALVIITFTYPSASAINSMQASSPSTQNYKEVDKSYVNYSVVFYNYVDSSDIRTRMIDYFQKSLSCCGVNSPSDWTEYSLHKIPKSCCSEPVESSLPVFKYCAESDHKIGCWRALNNHFQASLPMVRLLLFMLIGFGILCTAMACFMIWTLRSILDVV